MKIAVFSAQPYDRQFLDEANEQLFSSNALNEVSGVEFLLILRLQNLSRVPFLSSGVLDIYS